jgi:hypothetical protein
MSFKTISIPSRTAQKKRAVPAAAAAPAYVPATSASMTPRSTGGAAGHRYAIGERLAMAPGGREFARGAATCTIVSRLPHEGGPLRYRVRSDSETYERIVDENDLSVLPSDSARGV